MLTQLIYTSSASRPLDAEVLGQIRDVSRRNNAEADVTGALLHSGGNFMQVLEGTAESVAATYRRIETDPRHRGHVVLLHDPIGKRQFPDRPMDFYALDRVSDEERRVARRLFDPSLPDRERAHLLIKTLRHLADRDIATKAA